MYAFKYTFTNTHICTCLIYLQKYISAHIHEIYVHIRKYTTMPRYYLVTVASPKLHCHVCIHCHACIHTSLSFMYIHT